MGCTWVSHMKFRSSLLLCQTCQCLVAFENVAIDGMQWFYHEVHGRNKAKTTTLLELKQAPFLFLRVWTWWPTWVKCDGMDRNGWHVPHVLGVDHDVKKAVDRLAVRWRLFEQCWHVPVFGCEIWKGSSSRGKRQEELFCCGALPGASPFFSHWKVLGHHWLSPSRLLWTAAFNLAFSVRLSDHIVLMAGWVPPWFEDCAVFDQAELSSQQNSFGESANQGQCAPAGLRILGDMCWSSYITLSQTTGCFGFSGIALASSCACHNIYIISPACTSTSTNYCIRVLDLSTKPTGSASCTCTPPGTNLNSTVRPIRSVVSTALKLVSSSCSVLTVEVGPTATCTVIHFGPYSVIRTYSKNWYRDAPSV